ASVAEASGAVVVGGLRPVVNPDGLGAARDARIDDSSGRQACGPVRESYATRVLHPPLQPDGAAGDLAAAALDAGRIAGWAPALRGDGQRRSADSDRVATRAGAAVDRSFTSGTCVILGRRFARDLFASHRSRAGSHSLNMASS